jgi:hypothetical protein
MAASQSPQESRSLPERPDLQQLKKHAKELLKGYRIGDSAVIAEVETHEQEPNPAEFALNDAQRVLARAYGFSSWSKLIEKVNGFSADRFWSAALEGDLATLKSIFSHRPELVRMEGSGHGNPLHSAVLNRDIACATRSDSAEVAEAIRRDDLDTVDRITAVDERGRKPLHHAASARNRALTARILQFDHELNQSDVDGLTPTDCAVLAADWTRRVENYEGGQIRGRTPVGAWRGSHAA